MNSRNSFVGALVITPGVPSVRSPVRITVSTSVKALAGLVNSLE